MEFLLPLLVAILMWWLGTGAVILLDRHPAALGRSLWTFLVMTGITAGAVLCVQRSSQGTQVVHAYAGFACALVLWGWHEVAFLGGWITGPRREPLSCDAPPFRRLSEAVQVVLWHELALIGTVVALWAWLGQSANPITASTFTLLYVMRASAKINLYLGVRNLGLEFLPDRLIYVGSYFARRRFNGLMPVSLVLGLLLAVWWVIQAVHLSGGVQAGRLLLAALLLLAVAEHLMMVVPVQPSALWRWALRPQGS
jgi:putative photosynthetic complex assembly protein 2